MPQFREYSRAEILADGFIHLIGICASITAVALLLAFAIPALNGASVAFSIRNIEDSGNATFAVDSGRAFALMR